MGARERKQKLILMLGKRGNLGQSRWVFLTVSEDLFINFCQCFSEVRAYKDSKNVAIPTWITCVSLVSHNVFQQSQAEVLSYRSTWFSLWLWKINSADAFMNYTLFAIYFGKLWVRRKLFVIQDELLKLKVSSMSSLALFSAFYDHFLMGRGTLSLSRY